MSVSPAALRPRQPWHHAGALVLLCLVGIAVPTEAVASLRARVGSEARRSAALEAVDALVRGRGPRHRRLRRAQSAVERTVNVATAVRHLRRHFRALPKDVSALVDHAAGIRREDAGADPAYSAESITKARKILNNMMLDAGRRLDKKVVSCQSMTERHLANKNLVDVDVARLAGQIADMKGQLGSAVNAVQEAEAELSDAKHRGQEQRALRLQQKAEDEQNLQAQRNDAAVAEFVLQLTQCKKTGLLLQTGAQKHSSVGARICQAEDGSGYELVIDDPAMRRKMARLSRGAQALIRRALGGTGNSEPVSLLQMGAAGSGADDGSDDDDGTDQAISAAATDTGSQVAEEVDSETADAVEEGSVGEADAEAEAAADDATVAATPTQAPTVPPTPGSSRKCVMEPADCGLLTDSMSLLWGEMKDSLDELQAKMVRAEAEHQEFMSDLRLQMETLTDNKGHTSEQLAEATANLNGLEEELKQKRKEKWEMQAEFKRTSKECTKEIHEILYTDICGVRKVRAAVMAQGSSTTPVQDCEVTDWLPGECSMSCDDNCPHAHNGRPCGGLQLLTRDVLAAGNELGVPCPALKYRSSCNQMSCPVDCGMSHWSGWSRCTKDCEGGIRQRTRSILKYPKNAGEVCDSVVETQPCNVGSCDQACQLSSWSGWAGCSAACGTGYRARRRHVVEEAKGDGTCPKADHHLRLEVETCNEQPCVGDERCIAKQDLVLAIDGSGSMKADGFQVVKEFAAELLKRYDSTAYGNSAALTGVVEFGNGKVLADGTVAPAVTVLPLQDKPSGAIEKVKGLPFLKGFTNMAQAFLAAEKIFFDSGRKDAASTIVVISDGVSSFKHQLMKKVRDLKDKGTNIFMIGVSPYKRDPGVRLMRELASAPARANFRFIPGQKMLKKHMAGYVTEVLAALCPRSESPSLTATAVSQQGFQKLLEGQTCKAGRDLLARDVFDTQACMKLAQQRNAKFFSFGVRWSKGKCWAEKTTDKACSAGWQTPVFSDFYQIQA